jgi:hypothetical protein
MDLLRILIPGYAGVIVLIRSAGPLSGWALVPMLPWLVAGGLAVWSILPRSWSAERAEPESISRAFKAMLRIKYKAVVWAAIFTGAGLLLSVIVSWMSIPVY